MLKMKNKNASDEESFLAASFKSREKNFQFKRSKVTFKSWEWKQRHSWGRPSSVDSHAPTIQRPGFETLALHLLYLVKLRTLFVIVLRKVENKQKRPGLALFLIKENNTESYVL